MLRRGLFVFALALPASAANAQTKAVVAPAGGNGIQAPLLPVVTGALRDAVSARGWTVLGAEETEPVVIVARTPPVPTVEEMRRLAGSATAAIAAHVELAKAPGGRVLVRVRSATRDAPGSWEASETVASGDVIPTLGRLAERAVPPAPTQPPPIASSTPGQPPIVSPNAGQPPIVSPSAGQPPIVSPNAGQPPIVSPNAGQPPVVSPNAGQPPVVSPNAGGPPIVSPGGEPPPILENTQVEGDGEGGAGLEADVTPPPATRPLRYHLWVGPMTEGAIGTNRSYYNQMAGARATYLITRQFGFDAVATYAYLSDDPGFALAFWGGVQARIGLSSTRRTSVPVRFGLGYMPVNGALVKVEGGLLFPLNPKTDLVLTLLSPTIWFLEGGNAVSMNIGIEIGFATL